MNDEEYLERMNICRLFFMGALMDWVVYLHRGVNCIGFYLHRCSICMHALSVCMIYLCFNMQIFITFWGWVDLNLNSILQCISIVFKCLLVFELYLLSILTTYMAVLPSYFGVLHSQMGWELSRMLFWELKPRL